MDRKVTIKNDLEVNPSIGNSRQFYDVKILKLLLFFSLTRLVSIQKCMFNLASQMADIHSSQQFSAEQSTLSKKRSKIAPVGIDRYHHQFAQFQFLQSCWFGQALPSAAAAATAACRWQWSRGLREPAWFRARHHRGAAALRRRDLRRRQETGAPRPAACYSLPRQRPGRKGNVNTCRVLCKQKMFI